MGIPSIDPGGNPKAPPLQTARWRPSFPLTLPWRDPGIVGKDHVIHQLSMVYVDKYVQLNLYDIPVVPHKAVTEVSE